MPDGLRSGEGEEDSDGRGEAGGGATTLAASASARLSMAVTSEAVRSRANSSEEAVGGPASAVKTSLVGSKEEQNALYLEAFVESMN